MSLFSFFPLRCDENHAVFFSSHCTAVLGCRLSPVQKAALVRLVKRGSGEKMNENIISPLLSLPELSAADVMNMYRSSANKSRLRKRFPVTLAIGDGANDVAMLREVGFSLLSFVSASCSSARRGDGLWSKTPYFASAALNRLTLGLASSEKKVDKQSGPGWNLLPFSLPVTGYYPPATPVRKIELG